MRAGSPLDYREHLVNDLQPAAISLRPEIEDALAALAEAGAAHAMVTGSGPTAFGLYPTADEALAAADGPARALPRGDRDRPARSRERRGESTGSGSGAACSLPLIVAFFVFRDDLPHINLEKVDRGPLQGARRLDLPAGRRPRLPGDGRLRRPGRAGRVHGDARRRGCRPGRHLAAADPRDHLALRLRRGLGQLPARREARAAGSWSGTAQRFRITGERLEAGRGLLRPLRRQDDPDRPLHRPGPGAGAVHRRQQQVALPGLRAVQHPRHRALVNGLDPARLLLLAEPRAR